MTNLSHDKVINKGVKKIKKNYNDEKVLALKFTVDII